MKAVQVAKLRSLMIPLVPCVFMAFYIAGDAAAGQVTGNPRMTTEITRWFSRQWAGVVASASLLAWLWSMYEARKRRPEFDLADYRINWFQYANGPNAGIWIGYEGALCNKGNRDGSLMRAGAQSPLVKTPDGPGCYPAGFVFPLFVGEGNAVRFDALFHISRTPDPNLAGDVRCTITLEDEHGRARRFSRRAQKTGPPRGLRVQPRKTPWEPDLPQVSSFPVGGKSTFW